MTSALWFLLGVMVGGSLSERERENAIASLEKSDEPYFRFRKS